MGEGSNLVVIMPQYKLDPRLKVDREVNIPPRELFIPLGWDDDAQTKRKHYRSFVPCELENDEKTFANGPSPFDSFDIKRG